MIGVFDSGVGGFCALRELRRLLPSEDIVYLADRKNAPYGTKSQEEIIALTQADIKRLRDYQVNKILIACCTASSVHEFLDKEEREISLPIIRPAAQMAAEGRRIAVIATERTVSSAVFSKEISKISDAKVVEFSAQRLVTLVEGGCRDGRINTECERELCRIAELIADAEADTLILGCTHFSHLEGELQKRCNVKTVSPAREGAAALTRIITKSHGERGRIIYI